MRLVSSPALQFVLVTICAVALGFTIPVFVHRQEYAKAVADFTREPSQENERTLTVEWAKNQHVKHTTHEEVAVILIVVMNTGWFLIRRQRRKASMAQSSPR